MSRVRVFGKEVKMKHLVLSVMVVLAVTSLVNAGLTSITCDDDNDGVITMPLTTENYAGPIYPTDVTFEMDCIHHNAGGVVGNVQGDFNTDTELDPTVHFLENITNDTGFAWTGYTIYIRMNKTFRFLPPTAIVAPAGWTYVFNPDVLVYTTFGGTLPGDPSTQGYVGSVTYSMGTGSPIAKGGTANFGFKIQFAGSASYCTEQTPVPEPISLVMFAMSGLALIRLRRNRR